MLASAAGDAAILGAVRGCTLNEKIILGSLISTVLLPMLRSFGESKIVDLADHIMNDQMGETERNSAGSNNASKDAPDSPHD